MGTPLLNEKQVMHIWERKASGIVNHSITLRFGRFYCERSVSIFIELLRQITDTLVSNLCHSFSLVGKYVKFKCICIYKLYIFGITQVAIGSIWIRLGLRLIVVRDHLPSKRLVLK